MRGSKSICVPERPMRTSCRCCCNDFRPSSSSCSSSMETSSEPDSRYRGGKAHARPPSWWCAWFIAIVWWPRSGHERTHRRTRRHHEFKRRVIIVIVFQSFMLFGLLSYTILLYTRSTDYGWDKCNRPPLSCENPYSYVLLYLMYHHVVLLHQTNAMLTALAQDPSARMKFKIL